MLTGAVALFFAGLLMAQDRPAKRQLKGMELYGWRDPSSQWVYALLPGTNRIKTEAEIKQPRNQIAGVKELEQRFLQLAPGEQIFWSQTELGGHAYPDTKTLKEIVHAAKKAEVELFIPSHHPQ